ncbi:hypothetical protein HOLleu_01531 [Holothuria leucospilota]|uniref:Uncharacterized protein n=1 Tax=Holothuria leucospilota TaxID=206669 RepID=A0A9Q1CP54_HOLLE|nr:hypothetical protein HOLleu_01531 [Holothuria leucospilota]
MGVTMAQMSMSMSMRGMPSICCLYVMYSTIINVVARWPGRTHDSTVLRETLIGRQFCNQ